ncbi:MAG: hypothetical protein A2Z88_07065 [Omnitrophica WOR_2 bacterium GWA2_47_8]|nr:MAG: hypothetical protein A2Z88_07065 [Omnitrophica WOR_2 bacterium GWA2_47_8]
MKNYLRTHHRRLREGIVLVTVLAFSGCGQPSAPKGPSGQENAGSYSAGIKKGCVGMGCDDEVSAGLKEKCVGMGCPPEDAQ